VTDDIISAGKPRREPDQAIESLFRAWYPRLARTAFCIVGDWDLAEQLAQEAYCGYGGAGG
jgi:DNA-directed RNA polymerase specialized sigma24 family protein